MMQNVGTIGGSRPSGKRRSTDLIVCTRCGYERHGSGGGDRTGLCRSCTSTMSKAEILEWKEAG